MCWAHTGEALDKPAAPSHSIHSIIVPRQEAGKWYDNLDSNGDAFSEANNLALGQNEMAGMEEGWALEKTASWGWDAEGQQELAMQTDQEKCLGQRVQKVKICPVKAHTMVIADIVSTRGLVHIPCDF